jgi:flagellar hook-length control protein FliK
LNNVSLAPTLAANKISLYEAQYASRLGMAVVEKVRAGRENFDIHLQPESFGKIKVNVTLDFRAIDVKIFTETLGAAAIFKDHENTLQQIMEQNGMKLASFTVGAQNGNDQQRQFANQNKDRTIGKATGRGNKVINTPNTSENSNGEPTGLNLIA